MICNENARNSGKLLAAIVAMLMVVCAVAVVSMPDSTATNTTADTSIDYGDSIEMNQTAWDAMKATSETNSTSTYYPDQKVLKLDDDQTWNLTGNITDSDVTLDLNGHDLKIVGKYTITLTNNSADDNKVSGNKSANISALDNNGNEKSNLMIDGSTVTLIGNGSRTGGVWAVDATNIGQTYLVNGATLNAQKTEDSAVTGTVWCGSGGVTTVFLDGSKISFSNAHTDGAGVSVTAIFAYNGSTVDATGLMGGSISVYADIKDSEFSGNTVGLYAANVSGESTVTANTLGVYSGTADAGFDGFTTNQVSVEAGSEVNAGTIINSLTAGTAAGTDSVVFTGKGSVSGTFTEIEETTSNYSLTDVTITGSSVIDSNVNVTANGITVDGNLRNKGTLGLGDSNMTVNGRFTNSNTVTADSGAIVGDGKVTNESGATMGAAVESSDYTNNNTSDLTVFGDSTGTQWYPARQNITVPEGQTWNIIKDNVIVIPGTLTVEGNLVIEEGGVLIIGGVDNTDGTRNGVGKAVVEGTLTVEEGAKLIVAYGSIDIDGTADIDGDVMVGYNSSDITDSNATYNMTGKMASLNINSNTAFSEYSTISQGTTDASIVVADDITLTIEGAFSTGVSVSNSGSVVIDSEPLDDDNAVAPCTNDIMIYMMADGASVEVRNLALDNGANLQISDRNVVKDSKNGVTIGTTDESRVKIDTTTDGGVVVSGLTVVENYGGIQKIDGRDTLVNSMDLSGDLSVEAVADVNTYNVRIALAAGDFTIADGLSIGESVTLDLPAANGNVTLDVSGYVPVNEDGAIKNAGEITVSGAGHIYMAKNTISGDGTLNAAYYETTENAVKYNNYVTIDTAIANANADSSIDEIVLYGEQTVTVSATLPAIDLTFKTDKSVLNIGTTDDRDVRLDIAEGASYGKVGQTNVNGVLYFNDRTDLKAPEDTVKSDVVSYEVGADGKVVKNGWAMYTNIYTAMSEAVAGDVINVRENTKVELDSDFTVKDGVTVIVPDDSQIVVGKGVTLTINGTLQSERSSEGIVAETTFATKASNKTGQETSAIVVNGTLKTVETIGYGPASRTLAGSCISGAYYTDGEYNYVTPLSIAVSDAVLPTIEGDFIRIYGTVTEGDTVFTATETCGTIAVQAGAKLTLSSLTLANEAALTVDAAGFFTGSVAVGDAGISAVNVQGASITSADGLNIVAANVEYDDPETDAACDASLNITTGTVVVTSVTGDLTVDAGATLAVPSSSSSNKIGTVTGDLTVDGTMAIGNGQTMNVEGTLFVNGTVTVAAETDTSAAGTVNVDDGDGYMYVGLDDEFATTGEAASVTGVVTVKTVYALSSASVDTAMTDDMETTAYYVEGQVWINAYSSGNSAMIVDGMDNAPVENAYFNNVWKNEDGTKEYTTGSGAYIGAESAVYADIDYDIYVINLRADQNAVSSISIDGNLMQFGMIYDKTVTEGYYYGYTAVVSAGSHKIDYQLTNGYSGNGILTVNGTQQSGLNFTTEGNPTGNDKTVTYNLQLSGFEKSGYVPDSPDTPTDSGDDGMSITDILLIVLVVLIIIMAIIVAIRLMRS